jgi:small subunit ribosomal protein S8e
MVEWRKKSKRKSTGGINNSVNRKTKSLSDRGGLFSKTVVDEKDKRYKLRTIGGNNKVKIAKANTIVVLDGTKSIKGKILTVENNSANKHFVRQKVVTKGAVLKVDLQGKETKVKVTSRPGQSGQVSGVIIK